MSLNKRKLWYSNIAWFEPNRAEALTQLHRGTMVDFRLLRLSMKYSCKGLLKMNYSCKSFVVEAKVGSVFVCPVGVKNNFGAKFRIWPNLNSPNFKFGQLI